MLSKFLTNVGVFLLGFDYRQPAWGLSYVCMKLSEALIYAKG